MLLRWLLLVPFALIRALYDWCTDNGFTAYVAVFVDSSVQVPSEYVKNGEIVLNVGFEALRIVNELRKPEVADVESKILGRDVFQIVRFVEDDCRIVRQNRSHVRFANGEISEKQGDKSAARSYFKKVKDKADRKDEAFKDAKKRLKSLEKGD